MTKIINLYGGPSVGKSTLAAGIFYKMKMLGFSVELVTEYAKELVYEDRMNILLNDQLYIFAKQQRKIARVVNHNVDFIVTDSPLLMSSMYAKHMNMNKESIENLIKLVESVYKSYDTYDFLIKRNVNIPFEVNGRVHNLEESKKLDLEITEILNKKSNRFYTILSSESAVDEIINIVKDN